MDLQQIKCFIAVAESLNFTVASEKLFLSQPSLSRHIQNLEKELDIVLFRRDNKNVVLTDAGIQLLSTARKISGAFSEFVNSAEDLKTGKRGKLCIGYQGSASSVIPPIIGSFTKKYPDINLSIEEFGAKELIDKLNQGEVDIAILYKEAAEGVSDYSNMKYQTFFTEDMVLFMGEVKYNGYVENCSKKSFRLTDFSKERFIMIDRSVNPGYYDYLQKLYIDCGLMPLYPAKQPALISTLILELEAELGVALLPKSPTLSVGQSLKYIVLEDLRRQLHIDAVWSPKNFNSSLYLFTEMLESRL